MEWRTDKKIEYNPTTIESIKIGGETLTETPEQPELKQEEVAATPEVKKKKIAVVAPLEDL